MTVWRLNHGNQWLLETRRGGNEVLSQLTKWGIKDFFPKKSNSFETGPSEFGLVNWNNLPESRFWDPNRDISDVPTPGTPRQKRTGRTEIWQSKDTPRYVLHSPYPGWWIWSIPSGVSRYFAHRYCWNMATILRWTPSQQEDCLDQDICGDSCYTECVRVGNIQPKVLAACGLQRERKSGGTTKMFAKSSCCFRS